MVEEPTGIGTVLTKPGTDRVAVLSQPGALMPWRVWNGEYWSWAHWSDICKWSIVCHGYTLPINEPTGEGAVIRNANGSILYAIDSITGRRWIHTDGSGSKLWNEVDQPVKVLFEGVS